MDGPVDSPYAGGKFKIQIEFPVNYLNECPIFRLKLKYAI